MSTQTSNGKAFEYACVTALHELLAPQHTVIVTGSAALSTAQHFFEALDPVAQTKMLQAARAGLQPLSRAEPMLTEAGKDEILLTIQADREGIGGDVRDVLVQRKALNWEIGLSVKNNHFAAKHPRLSQTIDFGKEWFGRPCSESYKNEITPIFDRLKSLQATKTTWASLPDKIESVYQPLLQAFKKELLRLHHEFENEIPAKLLEYLIGRHDFYKFIKLDQEHKTIVQCFNFNGSLNRRSQSKAPDFSTGSVHLPSSVRYFDFLDSAPDNTLELILDHNWVVTFRIHSASTIVEPSLKFDIHVSGVPSTLFTAHVGW